MVRRLGLTLVTGLALLLATSVAAYAGYEFCSGDPAFTLEGTAVSVNVTAASPVQVVVSIPQDVTISDITVSGDLSETVSVSRTNRGWNGHGQIPVKVEVTADGGGPVWVSTTGGVLGHVSSSGNGGASVNFVVQPSN